MGCSIEVLFTPADFQSLRSRDLTGTVCVVFDVLRATTSMVTALANGAAGIIPVAEIADALSLRRQHPQALLVGERDGLRIGAALTGGVEFDLGNSPREYTRANVAGKTIISTTTNGTRAVRACAGAAQTLAAAFVNLSATAQFIARQPPARLILVCAGTQERTALEDALAAGAMCDTLTDLLPGSERCDSAAIAQRLYQQAAGDLPGALSGAANARRLLAMPDLRADVEFCLQRDVFDLVAALGPDGTIRTGA